MANLSVTFSNNYSPSLAYRRWQAGTYPSQHLYGVPTLEAHGCEVSLWDTSLVRGTRMAQLRHSAGLEARQLRRLGQSAGSVDLAGEPYHVAAIARARAAGVRRRPLVAVIHEVPPDRARFRRLLDGIDVCVCLSKEIERRLIEDVGRSADRTRWGPWGPDLAFAGYQSTGEDFVLSAGKTGRDVATLATALRGTGIPARIHGLDARTDDVVVGVQPAAHSDLGAGSQPQLSFEQVLPEVQACALVAIPLLEPDRLAGITELADALALGKPIVMTASLHVDVDLEQIGCGLVVAQGDVAGWRRAIVDLWNDPVRRQRMGAAGRAFAEREWNATAFGEVIHAAVRDASA